MSNILAYTYEADYHCIDCTRKRFLYLYVEPNRSIVTTNFETDENGILYTQTDNEGNRVHPLFSTDEWQELDWPEPTQRLICGNCFAPIDEYTHQSA